MIYPPCHRLRDWIECEMTPTRFEWLSKNPAFYTSFYISLSHVNWKLLSRNPNPEVLPLLLQYRDFLDWKYLSGYGRFPSLLKDNIDKLDWAELSFNDFAEAVELLKANPDKIHWCMSSFNRSPDMLPLWQANLDKLDWLILSHNSNPSAVLLLLEHPDKINVDLFSENNHDDAVEWLITKHPDKINGGFMSANTNDRAITWMQEHPDKIDWRIMSGNKNERAIRWMLQEHPDKIDWAWVAPNVLSKILTSSNDADKISSLPLDCWTSLSSLPEAMPLLETTDPQNLDWYYLLSKNTAILVYDYSAMTSRCSIYREELIQRMFHPRNITRFTSWGFPGLEE